MDLEKLGTEYGGWFIPKQCCLNENSIIYSIGVGEDISFDLLINNKYNSNIYLIDPTLKAKIHYEQVIDYYTNNNHFTGNIQKDYYNNIKNLNINLDKFHYIDKGIWNCETELKFYKQSNPNYVSQSLIENMFGNEYDIIKTTTIGNLMKQYNHIHIDLLKMDIEGA